MTSDFDPLPPARRSPTELRSKDLGIDWAQLERIVHQDPARRGLASFRLAQLPLDAGQYRAAAHDLVQSATGVAIVTGFCAQATDGVTAETDGPPGALFLARALTELGIRVWLVSDRYGTPLLDAGLRHWSLSSVTLLEMPLANQTQAEPAADAHDSSGAVSSFSSDNPETDHWVQEFFHTTLPQGLSHLIAIERPGPSYTASGLAARGDCTPAILARFEATVPSPDRDACHSMRGESLDPWTAPVHRLFEYIEQQGLPVATIGIGDGGNEIGMGKFSWDTLVTAIDSQAAPRIICRIATQYALIAGVSDWGAYALALSAAVLSGASGKARAWTSASQRALIESLVLQTSAVDGITLRREATVDGLPMQEYLRPLNELRAVLGISITKR